MLLSLKLSHEIDWRINEISMVKTMPYIHKISVERRRVYRKYLIPGLYSLWEGYVVKCFQIYVEVLNSLKLDRDKIHPNIIMHNLDMRVKLNQPRTNLQSKLDYTSQLEDFFSKNFTLTVKIPTESNLSFKTLNKVLTMFNLRKFDEKPFERRLNKLLKYRNSIAHGESSLPISNEIICELADTVVMCMDELYSCIIEGYDNKTYLVS